MSFQFNQTVSTTTRALPPVEERLQTLVEAMKTLADLTDGKLDPHLQQQFLDYAANLLAEHNRQHTSDLVTIKPRLTIKK